MAALVGMVCVVWSRFLPSLRRCSCCLAVQLQFVTKRPLLAHVGIGVSAFALHDVLIKQQLTSVYMDFDMTSTLDAGLQGGITGVFCKYWYPFLHRITEPKSPSAVTSAIFATPPPGRVFRKTVADTLLFVALSFGSLVVAVSTADGAVQDVQKHLEKGHPVSAEAMTDFLAIAEDARIIVNNRPSATWIAYPALSWALFRTVPLPLQGIAGIAQTLAMATGTIVLHRHELIEVNEAIANVEELFTYAGEHESELDDMIEQVERAIVESDRAIREQIEEQMTGKPTKDRDSTV